MMQRTIGQTGEKAIPAAEMEGRGVYGKVRGAHGKKTQDKP